MKEKGNRCKGKAKVEVEEEDLKFAEEEEPTV